MDIWLPAFALMLLSVACGIATYWTSRRKHHPFPPGPKPLPIVGNILGIDPGAPWVSYTEWGKTYGELVYTRILNQEIIIINSEEVAKDLLDRRSGNYSDRPKVIRMTNDFFGWSFNTAMISYSNRWRLHRRLFHQAFRAEASLSYRPIQMRKARELLLNLLEAPADFPAHFKTYSASVIMSIVYGYELAPRDDPIITIVERAVDLAIESIRPEVAAFLGAPPVRYVPSWFPGASFKRTALRSQKYAGDMVDAPFQFVEKNMESSAGPVIPSMVTESLKRVSGDDDERYSQAVRESSGTAFAAGSETTASTLLVFVLAMLLYPEVQQRAQAELDSVLGTDRLPGFEDRASMPYVEAVYRETLRWNPTVPLGIPHATTNADVYNGYFIPQGATIITNTWAMTRNEARYSNPEEFRPQRFFTANGELNDDHVNYAFGAGRRICVGRYIADASLWSAMVSILAKFNISKCKDGEGNEVPINPKWAIGVTIHPYDFGCNFVPRLPGLTVEKLRQMF